MTPIQVEQLNDLLKRSRYDNTKTNFLVNGFRTGFDMGYCGAMNHICESENIPLKIGSPVEMWNKIMKEVKER